MSMEIDSTDTLESNDNVEEPLVSMEMDGTGTLESNDNIEDPLGSMEMDGTDILESNENIENPVENIITSIEPVINPDVPRSLAEFDYGQGLAYSTGEGVEKNLGMAFEYFKNAAEKNYAPAQYKLGVAYAFAEGIELDKSQAVYWYQKAALQGHVIAQRSLGLMYENGDGVEQNKELALAWYSILSENSNIMDVQRKKSLFNELSVTEIETAEHIKNDLQAQISVNLY